MGKVKIWGLAVSLTAAQQTKRGGGSEKFLISMRWYQDLYKRLISRVQNFVFQKFLDSWAATRDGGFTNELHQSPSRMGLPVQLWIFWDVPLDRKSGRGFEFVAVDHDKQNEPITKDYNSVVKVDSNGLLSLIRY